MEVMGKTIQLCGKGERSDRSASYRCNPSFFNVLGGETVRGRSTQVYRESTRVISPIFETLREILKPKVQQNRSPRVTRSEFKSVKQNEKQSLKEYSRRIRYKGDSAFSEKAPEYKDKDLRDQF